LGQGQGRMSNRGRKSPFPRCKTSIGNNSGCVQHRAMKFACNMGCSAMGDQMVWSPSLSCGRKWPQSWN